MKDMLEEAGFDVVIASALGRTFVRKDIIIEPDLKLADAKIADYAGLIIPCAVGGWTVRSEEVAIAKQAVAEGKPVAPQHKGVLMLGEAGILAGKQYAFLVGLRHRPGFADTTYYGKGVVQDGNIITSGICPRSPGDGTVEFTQLLIAELRKSRN